MKQEEMSRRLHAELESVRVSPAMRQKTLNAIQGKDVYIMKRKLSTALVLVLIATLLCTAALAAAARWGMTDFWQQYESSYVPEDAASYIQTDISSTDAGHATIEVRELYYDGVSIYATVDVTPKSDKLLMIPNYLSPKDDSWGSLTKEYKGEEEQPKSILDVWKERGYTELMRVYADLRTEDAAPRFAESMDAVLNEDGRLTFSLMGQYTEAGKSQEAVLKVGFTRYDRPEEGEAGLSSEAFAEFTIRLPLTMAQQGKRYVSTEAQVFESVGVRVDRITLDAQPLNIYAKIEYTVVDEEKFAAQEDGLWFEFIDPESTEESYWRQRLSAGVETSGGVSEVDAKLFTQEETLGVNELHESYTLRAYNCWDKTRYETHIFVMQEE